MSLATVTALCGTGPALKMVGEFEASVKKYPLIPMDTPAPYTPPRAPKD
jgi:hypothetical protein